MGTLDRYIASLFMRNLIFVLLALVSLYGIIEFLEKVDNFIEHDATLVNFLLFHLYNLPLMISNSLPMAVLLSTFATIGGLSRTNQITALLSGGISVTRFSRAIFFMATLLSGLLLLCNTWITPLGIQETEYIKEVYLSKRTAAVESESNDLFFRSGDRIVHINRSFPQRGTLFGITIITLDKQFEPLERLYAETAQYQHDGLWVLKTVNIWEFSPADRNIKSFQSLEEWPINLGKEPSEVAQLWNNPEEMTQAELRKIIYSLKNDGHNSTRYQMESDLRFSKSAIPMIMVLLGVPFALQRGRKASFALGIVISLLIFAVYFILHAVFTAFGSSEILSPLVAAWSANLLMILIGTWLFLKAQD